jgi:hypothetical protein
MKIGTPEHEAWMLEQEQRFLNSFVEDPKDPDLHMDEMYDDPDDDEDLLLEKIAENGSLEDIEKL